MSEPFLSEIRIMSFNVVPKGWALCNGQLLPINQNQALFSLLGTTYGGDGRVNFALPNLQASVPLHDGNGFTLGQRGGEYAHTLIMGEMAQHNHTMKAFNGGSNVGAAGKTPDNTKTTSQGHATTGTNPPPAVNIYGTGSPSKAFASASITNTGGSQAHENRQPYLGLNFCIALQGIFPSQN
jgi:microcystin-dependent protein